MTSSSSSSTRRMFSRRSLSIRWLAWYGSTLPPQRVLRPGEAERRAAAGLRLDADGSALVFDDLFHQRQPDAGALHLVPRVQRLKDHEDLLVVLRLDARAVVRDPELEIVR